MDRPRLIAGDLTVDDRGQIRFVNDFALAGVKRFYVIENYSPDTIRAFHGHRQEMKYLTVVQGSALIAAVPFDDPKTPRKDVSMARFVLAAVKPTVVCIPPGYANGFKALEPRTILLVFSTATLEESKTDDYRFPADYWGEEVWTVQNR